MELPVRDPRCSAEDNDRFIDTMENYFERPQEFKRLQERPHLYYQDYTYYRIDDLPEYMMFTRPFSSVLQVQVHSFTRLRGTRTMRLRWTQTTSFRTILKRRTTGPQWELLLRV